MQNVQEYPNAEMLDKKQTGNTLKRYENHINAKSTSKCHKKNRQKL
jgi:hypothetical protein